MSTTCDARQKGCVEAPELAQDLEQLNAAEMLNVLKFGAQCVFGGEGGAMCGSFIGAGTHSLQASHSSHAIKRSCALPLTFAALSDAAVETIDDREDEGAVLDLAYLSVSDLDRRHELLRRGRQWNRRTKVAQVLHVRSRDQEISSV